MMSPTDDASKFVRLSGGDAELEAKARALIAAGRMVALSSDGGAMIFVRTDRPEQWKVSLAFDTDARGAAAKDDINDGLAWVFANTDAMEIMGTIDATNKACLALVPYTHGGKASNEGETYRYSATFDRWAAAIGVNSAVAMIQTAGNDEKLSDLRARGLIP